MRLDAIQIFGFKTFADKCLFEFPHNRIAIVGPNGCGKSNIVDAIKWVLGDQSTKSVRVQKMSEVIFNGTTKRSPLQLADVSINFDNSEGILPVEDKSVTIRRIVYRDGETTYKLNNKVVRLRDLRSLFLDSGVGLTEYSILEQGKIDYLLSLRPEQRVQYFDEAAGISALRNRRREIEQNLKTATEKEKILEAQINEQRELKTTRELQAEELERFQRMEQELRRLDAVIHHINKDIDKKNYQTLEEQTQHLRARYDALKTTLHAQESNDEQEHDRIQKLERRYAEMEKQYIQAQSIHESERQRHAFMQQELQRNERLLSQKIEGCKKLQQQFAKQEEQQATDKERLDEIQEQYKKAQMHLQAQQKRYAEIEERKAELQKAVKACKTTLIDMQQQTRQLHTRQSEAFQQLVNTIAHSIDVQHIKKQKDALQRIKNSLDECADAIRNQKIDAAEQHKLLSTTYATMKETFAETNTTLQPLVLYIEAKTLIDTDLDKIAREESLCKQKNNELQSALEEMQQQYIDCTKEIATGSNTVQQSKRIENMLQAGMQERIEMLENTRQHLRNLERECQTITDQLQQLRTTQTTKTSSSDLVKLQADMKLLKKELSQHKEKIVLARKKRERAADEQITIERKIQKNELSMARLSERITQLDSQDIPPVQKTDPLLKEDSKVLTDRRQLLKREVHAVGKLNFLAIDEKNEITEKLQELEQHHTDISESLSDLQMLYTTLYERAATQLRTSIEKIDKEFNTVFQTLFQGGEAHIQFCDETDIDKGIHILAKPPGKKPHDIIQLSGGERTLAAIALLFATYLVQPSPFCILDEVDAMLDERNIGRFLQLLYRYTDRTQFIIITHNIQTMAAMDALVGVTMEEPGVSKLVSVQLNEALYANT